jgi:putative heme iron utilization protein
MSHGPHGDALHHINTDHLDDLLAIARAFGGHADATSARAERVDAEGIDLAIETPRGPATAHVGFTEPVSEYPDGVRAAFIELTNVARVALAANGTTERTDRK